MDRTVFVALANVMDNERAHAQLRDAFSTVHVATERERSVAELIALGDTVDAAIVGVREHIDAEVLDRLPRLRVIGSIGAGTDHLDLDALSERNIQVITTPGTNATSVAEHTLMMILALAKRSRSAHAAVLAGQDRAGMPELPQEVRGRRVGLLGAGATSRALIPLLTALGTEVVVWTRRPASHPDLPSIGLAELFTSCSIVSIHLPLTARTRGMVDGRLLRRLPHDASLINVSRKEIIDPGGLRVIAVERPDLRFAIDDFGLAADGTVSAVGDRGLWSPHIAGVTVEALAAMQNMAVDGVVQAVAVPGPAG